LSLKALCSGVSSKCGSGPFSGDKGCLRTLSNNLIVSSASACVDCGSIANTFLSDVSSVCVPDVPVEYYLNSNLLLRFRSIKAF
jgi:hypothetical protein